MGAVPRRVEPIMQLKVIDLFFHGGHNFGVLGNKAIQRGGSGFPGADDDKIRQSPQRQHFLKSPHKRDCSKIEPVQSGMPKKSPHKRDCSKIEPAQSGMPKKPLPCPVPERFGCRVEHDVATFQLLLHHTVDRGQANSLHLGAFVGGRHGHLAEGFRGGFQNCSLASLKLYFLRWQVGCVPRIIRGISRLAESNTFGFNEAGAHTPDNTSQTGSSGTAPRRRFNEAGAHTPDNTLVIVEVEGQQVMLQ